MQELSSEEKHWIWMAFAGIGAKTFYHILKVFGDAKSVFDAVKSGYAQLEHIPADAARALRAACSEQRLVEMLSELKEKGIAAVTRLSENYPPLLGSIPYPSPVLFVKGDISCASFEKEPGCISVVGTRRCTRKGYELARQISGELAGAGVTVVSGMARGIDTAAHSGALDAGGKTIAVLGCGVDVIYPPESADIYYGAIENGAIISELPPGAQPLAGNFPVRNRIIAGLSSGTLVVESETEGGTAITASMAISMGRDVFAVPGAPYSGMAALAGLLISKGACAAAGAADILKIYGAAGEENNTLPSFEHIQLDFLQRQIYNLLLQGDASVESITSCIKYPQSEINSALTMMELGGLIKRLTGGKYGI